MVPLGDSRNRGRGGCLACSDFPSGALRFSSGRDRDVDCWGVAVSLELFLDRFLRRSNLFLRN